MEIGVVDSGRGIGADLLPHEAQTSRLAALRILIVGGSADARALTTSVLTDAGAVVKAVGSARDALQWLAVDRPDAPVSAIAAVTQRLDASAT